MESSVMLVLGGAEEQYPLGKGDDRLLVLEMGSPDLSSSSAVTLLNVDNSHVKSASLLQRSAGTTSKVELPPDNVVWSRAGIAPSFSNFEQHSALKRWAPLFLIRTSPKSAHTFEQEILVCGRMRSTGCEFVRVSSIERTMPIVGAASIEDALGRIGHLAVHVRKEANRTQNLLQGFEVETKLTISGKVSIWDVAQFLWHRFEDKAIDGYYLLPGHELTRWHFEQDNFEVIDAHGATVGHYSFGQRVDGSWVLKVKNFHKDSLVREESHVRDVPIRAAEEQEGFLQSRFPGLQFSRLPSFERTRFDLNLQSAETGHQYGIEIDDLLPTGETKRLRQVEVEYMETVVHDGMTSSTIQPELLSLAKRIQVELAEAGISTDMGNLSKLTFLKSL